MKKVFFAALILLTACGQGEPKVFIPVQDDAFVHIYAPKGDTFPGPDTEQYLKTGEWHDEWVPNDHCFVVGDDGTWHMYGITHPLTPLDNVHEGENQLFHAMSPKPNFKESLYDDAWIDQPKLLAPEDRPGEIYPCHSPYVVRMDGLYYMVYGHSPMRFATSTDLMNWTPIGEVFDEEKGARDPHLLKVDDTYYMTFCTERNVGMRSSKDLKNWTETQIVFESTEFDPESPSIIHYDNRFYLFVCSWDGVNVTNDVPGAYQYDTYVFVVDKLGDKFDAQLPITQLKGHAPEIFQDETGDWYFSSVEYPFRGVSVDRLRWE